MFRRSLVRSSVALRAGRKAVQSRVFVPTHTFCSSTSTEDQLNESKKLALRKRMNNDNQLQLAPEVAALKMPNGLSPDLARILMPLVNFAYEGKIISDVRDELEDLTDQVNDPMEYEFLEYEANSDTLEDLSDPTLAAVQELNENRNLKKIPELYEAYMSLYSQLSNEREVNIILPGEPTSQELEILENELKAFYYKDPSISLTLKVSVNPAIGVGRIYCFDDYMLDLTTTDFTRELQTVMDARKNELEDTINELDELLRKPINADLPASNTNYVASHKKLLNQMYVACGFAASS